MDKAAILARCVTTGGVFLFVYLIAYALRQCGRADTLGQHRAALENLCIAFILFLVCVACALAAWFG
jgi:hypothetical protein